MTSTFLLWDKRNGQRMTVIQMIPHVWQWDFICITKREENQGIIQAFLECVALMKGTRFPSKTLMFDAMRVNKEVHSIGLVIRKFVSLCLTIASAGEIRILLTMAYNIINSSLRTGRGSSLGKRVIATQLCIKRRVGF